MIGMQNNYLRLLFIGIIRSILLCCLTSVLSGCYFWSNEFNYKIRKSSYVELELGTSWGHSFIAYVNDTCTFDGVKYAQVQMPDALVNRKVNDGVLTLYIQLDDSGFVVYNNNSFRKAWACETNFSGVSEHKYVMKFATDHLKYGELYDKINYEKIIKENKDVESEAVFNITHNSLYYYFFCKNKDVNLIFTKNMDSDFEFYISRTKMPINLDWKTRNKTLYIRNRILLCFAYIIETPLIPFEMILYMFIPKD